MYPPELTVMTTKRHIGPAGTDLAAALLIFVAGAAFGAVSAFVLGVKSMVTQPPLATLPAPAAQQAVAPSGGVDPSTENAAVLATYRGVIEKNDGVTLQVAVVEGVAIPISVMLTVSGTTKITALVPATVAAAGTGGTRTADGTLPPPLAPTASPYKEEARRLADLKVDDVIEFSADAGIKDGATVEAGYITWIFSKASAQPPGAPGDGGPAPLR